MATIVCFVCGNSTSESNISPLFSRSQRTHHNAPFFPFLEYHDPAPGASPMQDDWSVDACFVCKSILAQQWESFERGRMPIGKRLYWLKRPSGCEIRQPVSQIELEEILNEHSRDNCDDYATDEEDGKSPVPKPQEQHDEPPQIFCYSCGKSDKDHPSMCPVHCQPSYEQLRTGVPYYPTVLDKEPSKGAKVICNSITFLCISCLPKFTPEWHPVQKDFLQQDPTKSVLPRIPLPEVVLCYICGGDVSTKYNVGLVRTSGATGGVTAALTSRKPILGSTPLTFGFTYLCTKCLSAPPFKDKV
ncbi:uncharacterized protein LOC144742369 [Ciona intestinalis]